MTDPALPQKGIIAVTGATGYIGRATVRAALARGYGAIALGRRPLDIAGVGFQHYDLEDVGDVGIPPGCVAVLHLAANTLAGSRTDIHGEVRASTRIAESARQHGLPFIFVSSQTASPTAATNYGQSKWRIEQVVLQTGGCIVRPGLVYGGAPRGLFGQLCMLVKSLPVLPSLLPAPVVQPIHVDDLADGLLRAVEQCSSGMLCLAQDEVVSFTQFLRLLTRERFHIGRMFVPVPTFLIALLAPVAARIPKAPDIRRIQSLYAMEQMRTSADLKQLGLNLRRLEDGMHRSGNGKRRRQLQEAKALLTYVLRRDPPPALLRRYVIAVTTIYPDAEPLALPATLRRFPALIAALDHATARRKESMLRFRISCAVLVAEASPQGARRFIGDAPVSPLAALLRMGMAVAKDSFFRLGSLALAGPLKQVLNTLEHPAR